MNRPAARAGKLTDANRPVRRAPHCKGNGNARTLERSRAFRRIGRMGRKMSIYINNNILLFIYIGLVRLPPDFWGNARERSSVFPRFVRFREKKQRKGVKIYVEKRDGILSVFCPYRLEKKGI